MAHENLLLVEGRDDQYALREIARKHDIDTDADDRVAPGEAEELAFLIKQNEGYERLRRELPQELKASNLRRVGIVVDADDPDDPDLNVSDRWRSLVQALERAGDVELPDEPDPVGTVAILERPDRTLRVGVWIMPDNSSPGTLEDFLEKLVPDRDVPTRLWERARECVDNIPEEDRLFAERDTKKAYIYTWLAWQRKPGKQTGIAINAGFLDASLSPARDLVDWLRRLFEL